MRAGPAPPKYGSGTVLPGSPKKTPTGVGWNVSPTPMSSAVRRMASTSSRSSRLIHGGLRYLEHGHLRMVFESSGERRRLLELAPHLVRPLPFTWPVYAGARVPQWKLRAGK